MDPYKAHWKGETLDPYIVARIFEISDPIIFQALKKILRFGRKHKSLACDIREAITSLQRWEEIEALDESDALGKLIDEVGF